jgi:protein SCO1
MISRALLIMVLLIGHACAAASDPLAFAYDQRLGEQVPLSAVFSDERGRTLMLRQAVNQRPTILVFGYFRCPNLCGLVRDDLLHALSRLDRAYDYSLIVLSIDPAETTADAGSARAADIARFDHPEQTENWRYLTGSAEAIQALTHAAGFRSRFSPRDRQFLHPAGIVFLTGTGTVSSYLLGLGYQPSDVGLGLARAANGVTTRALPILLLCFHYDQTTGRYSLAIIRVVQLAGAITILVIGGVIVLALRRDRHPQ